MEKLMATEIEILDLGSDLGLRNRWFLPESFAHPAKLHLGLFVWLMERYTKPGDVIADPMAGIGSSLLAAAYQRHVIAREVEAKWLDIMRQNAAHIQAEAGLFIGSMEMAQGDARKPWGFTADHLLFSPPYGCSASRNPNARKLLRHKIRAEEAGKRYGARWQALALNPTPGSMGATTFHYGTSEGQIGHWRGKRYWVAMTEIYTNAYQALRGGFMIVIVKDHISKGKRVETAAETVRLCESLGFVLHARHQRRVFPLSLWQRRRKERGDPVVEEEDALVFRKV